MMCLYSDEPLDKTRHSDLVYVLIGGLGLLKQILRCWVSLNMYIYSYTFYSKTAGILYQCLSGFQSD